jgi:hypothetical protein
MLWMFERGEDSLRLETRYDNDVSEFVLVMHRTDGRQHIERFKEESAFRGRLEALERQLDAERWQAVGSPVLLREGWRI